MEGWRKEEEEERKRIDGRGAWSKKEEGEKNWAIDSLTFLELFSRKG